MDRISDSAEEYGREPGRDANAGAGQESPRVRSPFSSPSTSTPFGRSTGLPGSDGVGSRLARLFRGRGERRDREAGGRPGYLRDDVPRFGGPRVEDRELTERRSTGRGFDGAPIDAASNLRGSQPHVRDRGAERIFYPAEPQTDAGRPAGPAATPFAAPGDSTDQVLSPDIFYRLSQLRRLAPRVLGHVVAGILVLAAGVLGLSAFGVFIDIPFFSVIGSVLMMYWAWIGVVAALIAAILAVMAFRRSRSTTRWRSRDIRSYLASTTPRLSKLERVVASNRASSRRSGTRRSLSLRATAACVAAAAAAGFFAAGNEQMKVARQYGVSVNAFAIGPGYEVDVPDLYLTYTDQFGESLPMAVYLPDDVVDAPLIVWFHGGGWTSGDYDETLHNRWFADHGYVVVSAEYSLSDEYNHRWDTTNDQLLCATGAAADYTASIGADSSRVALMGDSAGGHLALTVGYSAADGNPCGGKLPEVAAVAPIYPVASPADFYRNSKPMVGKTARRMAEQFTGGSPDTVPEAYAAIDPLSMVTSSTPPTFIVLGGNDHLVPPWTTRVFYRMLLDLGVDATMIEIPYAEHAADVNTLGVMSMVYREGALEFFEKQGFSAPLLG